MVKQDFYEDYDGPLPVTVSDKIKFGLEWYTGDSGVSKEELEAYLEDLTLTARQELAASEGW